MGSKIFNKKKVKKYRENFFLINKNMHKKKGKIIFNKNYLFNININFNNND
jgi:hypothetical protein